MTFNHRCAQHLPKLFESGTIKSNPIQSFSGGLENITEGLNYIKEGKVRNSSSGSRGPVLQERMRSMRGAGLGRLLSFRPRPQNRGVKVTYKI